MLLIQHGVVMDPASGTEEKLDVLAEKGRILRMEKRIEPEEGFRSSSSKAMSKKSLLYFAVW